MREVGVVCCMLYEVVNEEEERRREDRRGETRTRLVFLWSCTSPNLSLAVTGPFGAPVHSLGGLTGRGRGSEALKESY
jgi:hypothetical protein